MLTAKHRASLTLPADNFVGLKNSSHVGSMTNVQYSSISGKREECRRVRKTAPCSYIIYLRKNRSTDCDTQVLAARSMMTIYLFIYDDDHVFFLLPVCPPHR